MMNLSEANYIVGIDVTENEATISYIDQKSLKPIIYDRSGGYGQVSIPTVMQYVIEEKAWLIGEHANMNRNVEGTLIVDHLLEILLNKEEVEIGGEKICPERLLFIYIENILESFKQLNPHATISSLSLALPDRYYHDIINEVENGLKAFENIKLNVVMSSQAVFEWLQYIKQPFKGRTLIFDYSYNNFATSRLETKDDTIHLDLISSKPEIAISDVEKVFIEELNLQYQHHLKLQHLSKEELLNIKQMLIEQEQWIFQKYAKKQSAKVYYSFAYPPFQKVLNYKRMDELIMPFRIKLEKFIDQFAQFDQVILIGKGCKLQWPVDIISEKMNVLALNPYEVVSNGCCLIAAHHIIKQDEIKFNIQQKEYGIMVEVNEKVIFSPLNNHANHFIIDFEDESEASLDIMRKDKENNFKIEQTISLNNALALHNKIRINLKLTKVDEDTTIKIEYLPM
ncbi:MAG: hypothetical protein CVV02_01860 [Firmicutes bacterium HGW-Firmicutes-7]|nr:MAG: hypothetical protein CVV02_01860 [Firmicutes bacterium HGW-Firmicutes-7]